VSPKKVENVRPKAGATVLESNRKRSES
jgi:hypothetical protein